jgi:hypothetical protein
LHIVHISVISLRLGADQWQGLFQLWKIRTELRIC